jgi:hypothetical protein
VPAWWCVSDLRCWAHIVDKWFDPQWEEKHNAGRKWRLLMPGPSHHQGNVSLNEYRAKWVCISFIYSNALFCIICNRIAVFTQSASHDGQPCSQFKAWVLAHKGKATSDVDYNPDDPPSAYTNPAVHSRVSDYNSMAKQVYGPEYDPSTHDLDGEIVTMVGHRKKRVRYYRGDDTLDATPTPTTSQTRAKSSSSNLTICPQPDTAQRRVEALEVISISFIVHSFPTMFSSHCNIGMKYCRLSWPRRGGNERRMRPSWPRRGGDGRQMRRRLRHMRRRLQQMRRRWIRCISGSKDFLSNWVKPCHR